MSDETGSIHLTDAESLAISAVVHQNYFMPDVFTTVERIIGARLTTVDEDDLRTFITDVVRANLSLPHALLANFTMTPRVDPAVQERPGVSGE